MTENFTRNIGLHHVVFFRACMESPDELDTMKLAQNYLETGANMHDARKVLKMVQASLVEVAKRRGMHGAARLLALPRGRLTVKATQPQIQPEVSFEQFQERYDPDGMFGYHELLEIYTYEYGGKAPQLDKRTQRQIVKSARLLEKKIRLINELSNEIIQAPAPEDWIMGWFAPRISDRLESVGLKKLQDIINYANFNGYRWWRPIKGIGELSARRIITWLHEQNFPDGLTDYALIPKRKLSAKHVSLLSASSHNAATIGTSVVTIYTQYNPNDDLMLSPYSPNVATLGQNRASQDKCRINAQNDLQALSAWLSLFEGKTAVSYKKELERFVLWATLERKKIISDLDTPDVAAYAAFLTDPKPDEKWVAKRRFERTHPGWRPFTINKKTNNAGLSRRSVAYALSVLSQACKWLVSQRYLDYNPFDGLPKMTTVVQKAELGSGKSFSKKVWTALRDATEKLAIENAEDMSYQRGWFALMLGFGTGMRVSELAAATVGDLMDINSENVSQAWGLRVIGKGKRERVVPIPTFVFTLLKRDLRLRRFAYESVHDLEAAIPLIGRLDDYGNEEVALEKLTIDAVSDIFMQVFSRAGENLQKDKPHIAARLRSASPHQLRHTYASMGVKTMKLKHVQDNLGHASIATTSIYLHSDQTERFEDTDQFFEAHGS